MPQSPSDFAADHEAPKAKYIKIVIFDSLTGGKVILNQTGPHTCDLVSSHPDTHTTATNRDAAIHVAACNGVGQSNDKIGIIVFCVHSMIAKIVRGVTGLAHSCFEILLEFKAAVIGCIPIRRGLVSGKAFKLVVERIHFTIE